MSTRLLRCPWSSKDENSNGPLSLLQTSPDNNPLHYGSNRLPETVERGTWRQFSFLFFYSFQRVRPTLLPFLLTSSDHHCTGPHPLTATVMLTIFCRFYSVEPPRLSTYVCLLRYINADSNSRSHVDPTSTASFAVGLVRYLSSIMLLYTCYICPHQP